MITKEDVKIWVENGVMDLTVHSLDSAHSYKVAKFKNIVRDIYRGIRDMEQQFFKDLNIDETFVPRINELSGKDKLTKEEKKELDKLRETDNKYGEMQKAMLAEEVDLKDVKAMPYSEWKKLQDENKECKITYRNQFGQIVIIKELLMVYEEKLENILWVAPTE